MIAKMENSGKITQIPEKNSGKNEENYDNFAEDRNVIHLMS